MPAPVYTSPEEKASALALDSAILRAWRVCEVYSAFETALTAHLGKVGGKRLCTSLSEALTARSLTGWRVYTGGSKGFPELTAWKEHNDQFSVYFGWDTNIVSEKMIKECTNQVASNRANLAKLQAQKATIKDVAKEYRALLCELLAVKKRIEAVEIPYSVATLIQNELAIDSRAL